MRSPLTAVLTLAAFVACGGDRRTPAAKTTDSAVGNAAQAPSWILVRDDFDAPTLDPAVWHVMLPPGRAPGVFVRDGRVVLQDRGYLNTVRQLDPAALDGLSITGEWTVAAAGDDFLQILTRSDGVPVPPFYETRNGLEFQALTVASAEAPNFMTIVGRGAADGTVTDVTSPGDLLIVPGETYTFRVVDDGFHVIFTLTNKANPTQRRTVTAQSTYSAAANLVTFHNREKCCAGSHTALLDNVVIERLGTPIRIDVAPGRSPNAIAPRGSAGIPVAILSTPGLDATTLDPLTARFGPARAAPTAGRGRIEDVNGDGRRDLVMEFPTAATGIRCGATRVELVAVTPAGQTVRGANSIETVGCP